MLRTDYKDRILNTENPHYIETINADGTKSLEIDPTTIVEDGDTFSAVDINATNKEVNRISVTADVGSITIRSSKTDIDGWLPCDGRVIDKEETLTGILKELPQQMIVGTELRGTGYSYVLLDDVVYLNTVKGSGNVLTINYTDDFGVTIKEIFLTITNGDARNGLYFHITKFKGYYYLSYMYTSSGTNIFYVIKSKDLKTGELVLTKYLSTSSYYRLVSTDDYLITIPTHSSSILTSTTFYKSFDGITFSTHTDANYPIRNEQEGDMTPIVLNGNLYVFSNDRIRKYDGSTWSKLLFTMYFSNVPRVLSHNPIIIADYNYLGYTDDMETIEKVDMPFVTYQGCNYDGRHLLVTNYTEKRSGLIVNKEFVEIPFIDIDPKSYIMGTKGYTVIQGYLAYFGENSMQFPYLKDEENQLYGYIKVVE